MSRLCGFLHSVFRECLLQTRGDPSQRQGCAGGISRITASPPLRCKSHAWVVLERRRPSHRSPNSFATFPYTPFHRCVLIHLGVLEIFPGELLVGAKLLIGPVLFGSTDVCLIVSRVGEHVIR